MSKIGLHYTPEQLMEINRLIRDRFIQNIIDQDIIERDLPFDLEEEIMVVNSYFDDIDTILNEGEFIRIEKGGIIDEMT